MDKNHFISVLKNGNFVRIWTSQLLSIFCAYMLNFALSYKIFDVTGKSLGVSLLYVAYYLPVYVLGFFSGVVIDHISRRKILYITNILQAGCVLCYLLIGDNIVLIYPVIFIYSLIDQFYLPSEAAYLPELVNKENLPAANSFFSIALFGGLFFGFVLGGPIMRALGLNSPYYLASVFLIIAAFSTYFLPKDKAPKPIALLREDFIKRSKENIIENIRFIMSRPKVYFSIFINLSVMMIVAMLAVLLPALGEEVLSINILDLSWMIIFPLAVGAGFGVIFIDKKIHDIGKRMMISVGALLSGLILVGIYGYTFLSKSSPILLTNITTILIVLAILLGFAVSMVIIPTQTMLQEETPNDIRGRVYSSQKLLQGVFLVVPTVFSATMADLLGVGNLFLMIGILVTIAGIASFFYKMKNSEKVEVAS